MTVVTIPAVFPDGETYGGAEVRFALDTGSGRPGYTGTTHVFGPLVVRMPLDGSDLEVDLVPNTGDMEGSIYRVTMKGASYRWNIQVPDAGGPFLVGDPVIAAEGLPVPAVVEVGTVTVGTVEQGAVGEPPSVTNVGTARDPILDFVLPPSLDMGATPIDTTGGVSSHARMRDVVFNVRDFGAAVDGTTDDTAAIQAAVNACTAADGGTVLIPGTCAILGNVLVKAGVTLAGTHRDGCGIIIAHTSANVRLVADGARLQHLTIDAGGLNVVAVNVIGATASTVVADAAVFDCRLRDSVNNCCRISAPVRNFTFARNLLIDCHGVAQIDSATVDSDGIVLSDNDLSGVTTVGLQLYRAGSGSGRPTKNVLIEGNTFRDLDPACIPIEVTGVVGAVVRGNIINSVATRGVSCRSCDVLIIEGNVIRDQTAYAIELNGGFNGVIVRGNLAEDCATFLHNTGDSSDGPARDVMIEGNTYRGSGRTATATTAFVVYLREMERVTVRNNVFADWQYVAGGCVRIGANTYPRTVDAVVEGNVFIITDPLTPVRPFVNVSYATRPRASANVIMINRDLVAGDNGQDLISVATGATLPVSGAVIHDNHMQVNGTTASAPLVGPAGHYPAAPAACPGLDVRGNRAVGTAVGFRFENNSTDGIYYDNDDRAAGASAWPATSQRRTFLNIEGTAAPASGTWRRGDRVWNTAPSASGTLGWICVTAGTPGTWKTFGSIAA